MEENTVRAGTGMILGKFLPPHAGHQHLVDFGLQFVERLHVLVCSLARDPIPGELRYQWMRELFPRAHVRHITDELPQEPREHPQFWPIWRGVVQRAVAEPIDYVFASETYGVRLAEELQASFIPVDLERAHVPVSGSAIRANPRLHWPHLPACVRPYFVKRICLFGPESTGKSMLAAELARHFATLHVPEFARRWLDPKQGTCEPHDISVIARGQAAAEDALARQAHYLLFCDTDLLLTTIWSDVLFGTCPAWIRQAALRRRYDLYLLLDVDVPWVDDGQRFLRHRREEFFARCRDLLEEQQRPYAIIRGSYAERFSRACDVIEQRLLT